MVAVDVLRGTIDELLLRLLQSFFFYSTGLGSFLPPFSVDSGFSSSPLTLPTWNSYNLPHSP